MEKKKMKDEEDNKDQSSEQEAMQMLFQQIARSIQSIADDQPTQSQQHPLEEPELFRAMQSILGSITSDLRSTMTIKDENVQTDIETFRCK